MIAGDKEQSPHDEATSRGEEMAGHEREPAVPTEGPSAESEPARYIAYPLALKLLAERHNATAHELAGWVFAGPEDGGLCAYLNANELDPPPRFYFDILSCDDYDYLVPLMPCWFREADILNFEPKDRFVTGADLMKRWSSCVGIVPEAFIRAKIEESRLLDIHPIYGGTQGMHPEDTSYPPLELALFLQSHVDAVEIEDGLRPIAATPQAERVDPSPSQPDPLSVHPDAPLASDLGQSKQTDESDDNLPESEPQAPAVTGPPPVSGVLIRMHFPVFQGGDQNDRWWREKMANAARNGLAVCRVGERGKPGPGGSLWHPHLVAAWLIDRVARGGRGMSLVSARSALKGFPGGESAADWLFELPRDHRKQLP